MNHFILLQLCFILNLIKTNFIINKLETSFSDSKHCPRGYKLADLKSQKDFEMVAKLAFDTLGPNRSVWINTILKYKGSGTERWTIITPFEKDSCKFPPNDLNSFCTPFYWTRMSPNFNPKITLPSVCESNTNFRNFTWC